MEKDSYSTLNIIKSLSRKQPIFLCNNVVNLKHYLLTTHSRKTASSENKRNEKIGTDNIFVCLVLHSCRGSKNDVSVATVKKDSFHYFKR